MALHLEEQRRREEIERQKVARNREEQAGRGSLLNFTRYFWNVLEPPKRKLIEGWPLEAITFGDIQRLMMNVERLALRPSRSRH
jgi:hypothetical protein